MHPEINPQTVEDIGKHTPLLWTALGFAISGCGLLIKKVGAYVFNKWVCMQKEIEELKTELKVKDAEHENMKTIIHDFREELQRNKNDIKDEFQILHRRIDTHIEKGR
jgi:FtsZ-binding cell division protein ZapB